MEHARRHKGLRVAIGQIRHGVKVQLKTKNKVKQGL